MKNHTHKLETQEHDCNSSTDVVSKWAEQVGDKSHDSKIASLAASSLDSVNASRRSDQRKKANQNNSEAAL